MSRRGYGRPGRAGRIVLVLGATAGALSFCSAPKAPPAGPQLEPLLPDFPYAAWFTAATGYETDPEQFGAYSILPVDGTVYLGFGAAVPTHMDGALLAVFADDRITPLAQLTEQGVMTMDVRDGTVLIPGVDPCCPDSWEFGNFYTYSKTSGLVKRRNLPLVIHSWGLWIDRTGDAVYVTTGSHLGDRETFTGEIWRTDDLAVTWNRVAASAQGVGGNRTYDILRYHGRLYAVAGDPGMVCRVVAEPAGDATWQDVLTDRRVACLNRMLTFGDNLVLLDVSLDAVHVVSPTGDVVTADLPFQVDPLVFNWAAVTPRHVFAVASDGRVFGTADLGRWDLVATVPQPPAAIAYWPLRRQLVLATRGTRSGLYGLKIADW